MSVFLIPRKVRLRLESLDKLQRDFLYRGETLEKKPHIVRWCIVYMDRSKGALGLRSLSLLNQALLGKWSWRFTSQGKAFWKQVI